MLTYLKNVFINSVEIDHWEREKSCRVLVPFYSRLKIYSKIETIKIYINRV